MNKPEQTTDSQAEYRRPTYRYSVRDGVLVVEVWDVPDELRVLIEDAVQDDKGT